MSLNRCFEVFGQSGDTVKKCCENFNLMLRTALNDIVGDFNIGKVWKGNTNNYDDIAFPVIKLQD